MFNFFKKKDKEEENKKNLQEDQVEETEEELKEEADDKSVETKKELEEADNKSVKKEDIDDEVYEIEIERADKETNDEEIIDENEENPEDAKKPGFFNNIFSGLSKTRDQFSNKLKNLFTANVKIDDDLYEELEEILISSDIGMESTMDIVDELKEEIKERKIKDSSEIYPLLEEIMVKKLDENNLENDLSIPDNKLTIILVIGVNGVGKTTTIGKLAYNLKNEGKKVTLAAADTFRAAAIEQLGEWADRTGVEMIAHKEGSDPSAVIFDGIQKAKANKSDVLLCDTAGRLHNKKNLMNELEKINRTIDTHAPDANRENILVLDSTTGQNAISQLREFKNVTDITGLILTKLDGTAKGGVIFPLQVELSVPVKYIGVGEGVENLQKFDSESFVRAMFE